MAISWHDFRNPKLEVCYSRQNRVTIFSNRATILGAAVAYLSLIVFRNKGDEGWREKVRFADLETEERGDFLHSLPVYVCFNSFIDYAICKLNYE